MFPKLLTKKRSRTNGHLSITGLFRQRANRRAAITAADINIVQVGQVTVDCLPAGFMAEPLPGSSSTFWRRYKMNLGVPASIGVKLMGNQLPQPCLRLRGSRRHKGLLRLDIWILKRLSHSEHFPVRKTVLRFAGFIQLEPMGHTDRTVCLRLRMAPMDRMRPTVRSCGWGAIERSVFFFKIRGILPGIFALELRQLLGSSIVTCKQLRAALR